MKSNLEKLEDGTIKLTVVIPFEEVKKTWEEAVLEITKSANIQGFRKGKAPKKLVEERINKETVREDVLKHLLPKAYSGAIKEHNLNPIVNPKIHIDPEALKYDGTDDKKLDWTFTAFTCETPAVELNNYKDAVKKITAKSKIIIPGKEPEEPKFDEIMNAVITNVTVKVPKILLDQEVERLLSQTLDEIKKLGLTLDQYLASTGKTPEILRGEYEKKAQTDISIEFALQKIAEAENITVDNKEIEEAIQKAKDENERKNLEANRYLLAGILRQQKTLDFIKNL